MRLKYYLRGIGIGIFGTTILFMILISLHKNDGAKGSGIQDLPKDTQENITAQMQEYAKETGETEKTEQSGAKDPKEKQPSTQKQEEKPLEKDGQDKNALSGTKTEDKNPAPGTNGQDKPASTEEKAQNKPAAEDKAPQDKPVEEQKPLQPQQTPQKVRIEISGGQYSDVVCKKLEEAGLIDNAKSFNDFLVQNGFDNGILPGVYEIPKGVSYEEIAALLTTKVR